jgi:hypothetical protein
VIYGTQGTVEYSSCQTVHTPWPGKRLTYRNGTTIKEAHADHKMVTNTVSGATAVICGIMPNGCCVGYLKDCSMPTGWTEEGKEISGRTAYDIPAWVVHLVKDLSRRPYHPTSQ